MVIKGDTRSLGYSSYVLHAVGPTGRVGILLILDEAVEQMKAWT